MDQNVSNLGMGNQSVPLIERVREGMLVVDQQGQKVGKVEFVKMGDPQAATTKGETMRQDGLVENILSSVFGSGPDLPQTLRDQLLRVGFIRIDGPGLLDKARFVPANLIASVSNDTVTLAVPKNRIAEEQNH